MMNRLLSTLARTPRLTLLGALTAMAVSLPATAQGQISNEIDESQPAGDDYDTGSRAWNGLSTLTAMARGTGLAVEEVEDIDWDEMDAGDIVFLLYPTRRLEPGHVAAFVRNGGHVLVADDFGQSSEALGRLGMLRGRGIGVSAKRFYRDLQYAPIARPIAKSHPLAQRVEELATNHPSVLKDVTGSDVVFGFSSSEAVVVAGELGDGRFIVCSDPSIFINRMLQFQGNVEFAFNALRFLQREGTDRRMVILAGDFSMYGEPTERLDDGTVRGTVGNMINDFNSWLDERNDYLLTKPGMRAVAIILAVLIALLVLVTLPFNRKSKMDGTWTNANKSGLTPDDYEEIVTRYERTGGRKQSARAKNFLLPATILRDSVYACLERVAELEDISNIPQGQLIEAISFARGQMAASAFQRVHKRLNALPSRLQAASPVEHRLRVSTGVRESSRRCGRAVPRTWRRSQLDSRPMAADGIAPNVLSQVGDIAQSIIREVAKAYIGSPEITEALLTALVAGGHVLIEGVPGVAKTTLVKAFSQTLGCAYRRIQFTPDLLPSDITGTYMLDMRTNEFILRQGPVFTNVLLGDEINRAPAKTQSALLEAMQERQVTIEGETKTLEPPFIVLATQNPIEQEGTYALPEAQVDRFLIKLTMTYPGLDDEKRVLTTYNQPVPPINSLIGPQDLLRIQALSQQIHVSEEIFDYILGLIAYTRSHRQVYLGASPRASLALLHASKALALIRGRDFVLPRPRQGAGDSGPQPPHHHDSRSRAGRGQRAECGRRGTRPSSLSATGQAIV